MDKNILENIYRTVIKNLQKPVLQDAIVHKVICICHCEKNRAPIRFLMAGLLAKIENASIDLHKPYSSLGKNSYKGRAYDEEVVQPFIHKYNLPCNSTTAYLTPAFRTIEQPLTKDFFNKCRPKEVYHDMMDVVEYVEKHPEQAESILSEIVRCLLIVKLDNAERLKQLQRTLAIGDKSMELSSEEITILLRQHLQCPGSSRLPVLIVASAYDAVKNLVGESYKPLFAHNAADKQTGALGDIEIVISDENQLVTCYEMKKKRVTIDDISVVKDKICNSLNEKIDNYIIITTDVITEEVANFAAAFYRETGVEIVVLDCIGFINHFLHFFHRYRMKFLNHYQRLVLEEPDSSVSQPLKEAFLNLRRVAEIDRNN